MNPRMVGGESAQPAQRVFPSTHWSIIDSARREDAGSARPALAELLGRYLQALRAHLLIRRSVDPDQVDDVIQSFISGKVLEADLIARADRSRGKFRTLLLTALDRFVISQQRHDQAAKRGGGRTESLEALADPESAHDARGPRNPDGIDAFDIAWARQVLRYAIERMRAQCEADGRLDVWGVFDCRVLRPALEGSEPAEYEHVVKRFGVRSPTQLWNAVRTGKLLFARVLRSVVAEYAESDEELEAELGDLRAICARLPRAPAQPQERDAPAYP
jgi:RNA polymerase sigma-70 factor (ECF subfamily)